MGKPTPFLDRKSMTDGFKVAALVTGNGAGTVAQFAMVAKTAVESSQQVESYLRIGLLLGQLVLIVISIIYAYRKLKKPKE